MKLSDFLSVFTFAALRGRDQKSEREMHIAYNNEMLTLPKIICKDWFEISIQIGSHAYAASENGIRVFGIEWELVEWGFPSQPIDGEKYGAEDLSDTTKTVGAYVEIEKLQELIDDHGGIDVYATLANNLRTE